MCGDGDQRQPHPPTPVPKWGGGARIKASGGRQPPVEVKQQGADAPRSPLMASLLALIPIAVAGCGPVADGHASGGPLRVLATTGMIADAAKRVGGPHVAVDCLMGPGVDPHRFSPSAGDLGRLGRRSSSSTTGCTWKGK